MAQVTVTINGREYRIACDDGQEEHLLGLADSLETLVREIAGEFGQVGDARLILMASLLKLDELAEVREEVKAMRTALALKENTQSAAAAEHVDSEVCAAVDNIAQRLEDIALRLESA